MKEHLTIDHYTVAIEQDGGLPPRRAHREDSNQVLFETMNPPLLEIPPPLDVQTFDFTTLSNFVPRERTLLREEHTWNTTPARRFTRGESSLCCQGWGVDYPGMEFARLPIPEGPDWTSVHDALLFHNSGNAPGENGRLWWHEQRDECLRDCGLTGPFPQWVRTLGTSFPGSQGFAVIVDNNIYTL